MSKSLEEYLTDSKIEEPIKDVIKELEPDEVVDEIPSYLYTESGAVGYPDIQIQTDIYNLAINGTVPLSGDVSILDIGSGRSDFLFHVNNSLPSLNIEYNGFELNPLLAKIGIEKVSESNLSGTVHGINFLNEDEIDLYGHDYTFIIGSLNLNYGYSEDKWDHLESVLAQSLSYTNGKLVLILLSEADNDEYVAYDIPKVSEILLRLGLPFDIEYGAIPSVYKVTITNEQIYLS